MLNAIPSIMNGFPTSPPNRSASVGNRVQHRRNRVHVPSEIPFNFGRNTHSVAQIDELVAALDLIADENGRVNKTLQMLQLEARKQAVV